MLLSDPSAQQKRDLIHSLKNTPRVIPILAELGYDINKFPAMSLTHLETIAREVLALLPVTEAS